MKRLLLNFILLIASLLIALLLFEGILRIFIPIYAPQAHTRHENANLIEYDSSYGWFNRKDLTTWLEAQEYAAKIYLNKKGLRGREYSYEKLPGTKRMAVLGDSFTFGWGVDDNDTFSVKLEELFRDSGKAVDAINMGVNAYGNDQEYLLLRDEGMKYAPDTVICLFFGGNDIQNNVSGLQYGKLKPYFCYEGDNLILKNYPVPEEKKSPAIVNEDAEPRCRINVPFKSFLQRHSYTYTFLRLRYKYLLYKLGVRDSIDHAIFENGLKITEAVFLKMRELCDERGARLFIVIIPTKEQMLSIEDDKLQRELIKFFKENHINYIDLLKYLKGRKDLNFVIDSHWNKKGHEFIASILYDAVKE